MPAPIEFFFDFSSPYSYFASEQIEQLAARHGRAVEYKAVLLGAVFQRTGQRPLTEIPIKGDYSRRDFERSARYAGIAFALPDPFPISTVAAARALLWLQSEQPQRAAPFVHCALRAYFTQGRDISAPDVLRQVLSESGVDAGAAASAIQRPEIKERLKTLVDEAATRGVFGAPYIVVDGEPFWGNDRLPQIERWLAQGPF